MIPKFRAWHKREKKMYNVWSLGFAYKHLNNPLSSVMIDRASDTLSPEDVILMQSTGLKDKNGKELFEGDIVEFDYGRKGIIERKHSALIIKFPTGLIWDCLPDFEWKVIGNIHENPELLKKEKA